MDLLVIIELGTEQKERNFVATLQPAPPITMKPAYITMKPAYLRALTVRLSVVVFVLVVLGVSG